MLDREPESLARAAAGAQQECHDRQQAGIAGRQQRLGLFRCQPAQAGRRFASATEPAFRHFSILGRHAVDGADRGDELAVDRGRARVRVNRRRGPIDGIIVHVDQPVAWPEMGDDAAEVAPLSPCFEIGQCGLGEGPGYGSAKGTMLDDFRFAARPEDFGGFLVAKASAFINALSCDCLLYTSPSPRDS